MMASTMMAIVQGEFHEGRRGARAHGVIEKSRVAFQYVLNHRVLEQGVTKKLEDKLQIIQELW